ncbi:5-dehydro-2-deoxygluconokinase [Sporosarcina sp. CAU 1771]
MNSLAIDSGKNFDVIALGRIGVDLNPNEINRGMEEVISFTKTIGGSPANIAFGTARLGLETGFIGKVSNDGLGRYCLKALEGVQVDTSNVLVDQTGAMNGIAFTEVISPEECNNMLYRDNVADLKISPLEIDEAYIKNAKLLLISGTALSKSPSREATFLAMEYARKHNTKVVFDIDYRPYSWTSPEETAIYYNLAAEKCDVIIGTREEFDAMENLTNKGNTDDQVTAKKWFDYNAEIVVIKHGSEGSLAYTRGGEVFKGNVFPTKVLKTFGAGDSFAAGFMYGLLANWSVDKCLEFGSASAAIVISKNSCSEAMPTKEEVHSFIDSHKVSQGEV